VDILNKYVNQGSQTAVGAYTRQTQDPITYNDEQLQKYMDSNFAYNRILTAEDPIEERKRLENIYHLANYYKFDMGEVHKNYPAIARHYFGDDNITSNNQVIKDGYQAGKLAIEQDEVKSEYFKTPAEDTERRDSLRNRLEMLNSIMPPEDDIKRNLPVASAKEFMRNVPNWIDVVEKTTPFKAMYDHMKQLNALQKDDPTNAMFKGNTGSTLLALIKYAANAKDKPYIPTELSFLGGPAGMVAGAWKTYADREVASTYYDLQEIEIKGVDGEPIKLNDNQIRALSLGAGGLKATAEIWSDLVFLKGIPGIDKVFEKAFTKMAATSTVKKALNGVLGKILKKGVTITGAEMVTEWTQANIDLVANDFSIFLDDNKEMLQDFKVTKDEVFSTYKEVLVKTALATAPLALLGIGATGAKISISGIKAKINSPVMENIIKKNIAALGDNFTAKEAIDNIKADPEFQKEIGSLSKVTINEIGQKKEAMITADFAQAMTDEVENGVPEGQKAITQVDDSGLRRPLDVNTEEYKAALETFTAQNLNNYYEEKDLTELELQRRYQETIVDYGLDQDGDVPGFTYEQFKEQRLGLNPNYTNWRNTPDAQKNIGTMTPAVDVIQRVIDDSVVEDKNGALKKHSEELSRMVAEAQSGGDVRTILDYNIQKDLQIEGIDSEITRLQELGRNTKDKNQTDMVNRTIREYIAAKHELNSSRNELSIILKLVARELFNENRITKNLESSTDNLAQRLDHMTSPEYLHFLSGEGGMKKQLKHLIKTPPGENIKGLDQTTEEFLTKFEEVYKDYKPALGNILQLGRTIEAVDSHKKMLISIIQKSLSNYLKLNGKKYIDSINQDISKNVSKPRADLIAEIQRAVNLVDGIKEEDILKAKEYVAKTFYDADGKAIPSIQGENAKTVADTLMNAIEITLDSNLDKVGPKLSLTDLIHLKTEVDLLRYLGKVELSEKLKGNLISDEMRKSEFLVYQKEVASIAPDNKNIAKTLNFMRLQAYDWASKIFGKQGRKIFFTNMLTNFNKATLRVNERTASVMEAMNDDKHNWSEKVYETRALGNHEFMLQDLMFMYAGREDPDILACLTYKTEGVDSDVMSEYLGLPGEKGLIDSELTQEEKTAAEALVNDLRGAYNDIRTTYEAKGHRFGFLEAYLPLIDLDVKQTDLDQELVVNMLRGSDQTYTASGNKFILTRGITTKENAKRIRTDLFGIWQDYVQKQEHYINMNEWVRETKTLVTDPKVAATLTKNYSKGWTDGIKKYIEDIENPSRLHSSDGFDGLVRTYKHNVALANLAMKSNIMLRQLPSGLLYVEKAGLGNWINATGEFMNWKKNVYTDSKGHLRHRMVDFIVDRDPSTIKAKTEYEVLLKRPKTNIGLKKRKFDKYAMGLIGAADLMTKTIGWTAVYNKSLDLRGEMGAIEEARDWTALTQPSSNKLSLPGMYRHSELLNAGLMFTQQPVKLLNHLTGEVPRNIFTKEGNKIAGMYGIIALGLSNTLIWGMTNRRIPEDAEDWAEALILGGVTWIPGIGRSMTRHIMGKSSYSSSQFMDPAIGVLDLVNPFTYKDSIDAAQSGDMSKFNSQFNNIMKGIGVGFGSPSSAIINTKNAMGQEDWWSHLFLGGPLGEKK
jgi:hypothetical protein